MKASIRQSECSMRLHPSRLANEGPLWLVRARSLALIALIFVGLTSHINLSITCRSLMGNGMSNDPRLWIPEKEISQEELKRLKQRSMEKKNQIYTGDIIEEEDVEHVVPQVGGASAFCLLIKDDNDLLSEWIAYHYHVFNMRRLIVAVDPESKTTPFDVLEAWGPSKGNFNLNFTIWNDNDYTPEYFHMTDSSDRDYSKFENNVNSSVTIAGLENISRHDQKKASLLLNRIIKTDWHTNETYVAEHQEEVRHEVLKINNHRFRQRNFLSECYRQVYNEHPNSKTDIDNVNQTVSDKDAITWTVHIDTDEYLVVNPWIGKYLTDMNEGLAKHLKKIVPGKPSPGSLWSFYKKFLDEDEDSRICVMIPRILFGSKEVNNGTTPSTNWESNESSISWNHTKFESLRWKYHADYMVDTRPKAIANPGLMHKNDKIFSSKLAFSIHRPVMNTYHKKPGCPRQPLRVYNEFQFTEPLAVYHYLGSVEKYLARNDSRRGVDIYNKKNSSANFAMGDENDPDPNHQARWWIGGWLDNFVETYGGEKAFTVLGERYARQTTK